MTYEQFKKWLAEFVTFAEKRTLEEYAADTAPLRQFAAEGDTFSRMLLELTDEAIGYVPYQDTNLSLRDC